MRVNTIRELKDISLRLPVLSSVARKAVLQGLQHIRRGRLLVSDNEGTVAFGEPADSAFVTARVDVHDVAVYAMMVREGMVGCGEGYIRGLWSSPDLLNVIRVMAANIPTSQQLDRKSLLAAAAMKLYGKLHVNDVEGSRRNISAHYDLGNDFFALFLDSTMMYSSAIYSETADTLEKAAVNKLDVICQKLALQPSDHVVEIGTGWGGFACHAAQNYGCRVTTTTISQEQYNKAVERVASLGLQDKVTVLLQDYRLLEGQYDKLVSIEMIEAVGHEFYAEYFAKCSSLLKPDGQMLIQAILVSDQRYDYARRNIDFIKRYVFPGGCLPSNRVIARQVEQHTDMQITGVHDITYDYARTLADWCARFFAALPQVQAQGFSEEFVRLWEFYLCYCQAGFMERCIHTAQFVMAKPQWRDPRYPG